MINEVLTIHSPDLTDDANGDGRRDAKHDEFIEWSDDLISQLSLVLNLRCNRPNPANSTHHSCGTTVQPAALIIFGGGQPRGDFGETHQVIDEITGDLSLNNDRDTL